MFCPKCGTENRDGATFCARCGAPLSKGGEASPTGGDGGKMSSVIKIVGIVVAILLAIDVVRRLPALFGGIGTIIDGYLFVGIATILVQILSIFSGVILVIAVLLIALRYDPEKENGDNLLLVVASAGIIKIVVYLVARIIAVIFSSALRYYSTAFGVKGLLLQILYSVLTVAVFFVLLMLDGAKPFSSLPEGGIMALIKGLPDFLSAELNAMSGERDAKKSGANNDVPVYPDVVVMKENRSLLMYYIVGTITCGIYQWYVIYTIARDMNIMCEGDGEKTGGLIKYILLSWITCNIYSIVWQYKVVKRIQNASDRYPFTVSSVGNMDLNSAWLLFFLLGYFLTICGIGIVFQIFAEYMLFNNLNKLSKGYNESQRNVVY